MKTAIVVAHNPQNAGMYSVDLGALHFFSGLGLPVDFFCPTVLNDAPTAGYGQMTLNHLKDSGDLAGYDNVIYWGDFTTNPQYGLYDFTQRAFQHDGLRDINAAFQRWLDCFLPARLLNGPTRVFSFGQNFQTIWSIEKSLDLQVLAPLYNGFEAILPRDSFSVEHLTGYFPQAAQGKVQLGMDCAFLVNPNACPIRTNEGRTEPLRVGMCFGRSKLLNLDILVAEARGRDVIVEDLSRWLSLPVRNVHWQFAELLESVRRCDLIISDTYHLLINAMREGVAVQGVGVKVERQEKSVSDFKKRTLFGDLGLPNFYLELDDKTVTKEQADLLLQALDPDIAADRRARTAQNISEKTEQYRADLKEALFNVSVH